MATYNVHGGHSLKCRGASKYLDEVDENRKVKNKVIELLRNEGHTVYDCTDDLGTTQSKNLRNIVEKCNENKVDLDVSIHLNAGGGTGSEVWIYNSKNAEVASRVTMKIASALGIENRGVKTSSSLYVLKNTNSPAILIECCFVDSTKDKNAWNVDKCAKAIVEGILNASYMTPITGKSVATASQMQEYIKRKNPNVPKKVIDMIPLYISEGNKENIRGDVAFAQSCLETGNFKFEHSAVTLDQNNFCGMGVTSNGMKGNSFSTPQLGIRAQIQHLKAYANKEDLVNKCVDNRFKFVERGCAKYIEWLGIQENPKRKGWAAGSNYGEKILKILNSIVNESESTFTTPANTTNPFIIKVEIPDLNIRKGPGTNYAKTGKCTGKGTFTITKVSQGKGSKSGWGKLKSGVGWISLDYVTRI